MKKEIKSMLAIIMENKRFHIIGGLLMILNTSLLLYLPNLTLKIIDDAITNGQKYELLKFVLIFFSVTLFYHITSILVGYNYTKLGSEIIVKLRLKILETLSMCSGRFYSEIKTGEILTLLRNDIYTIEEFVSQKAFSIISDIFISIGLFIFLINLNLELLIVSFGIQFLAIFLQKFFSKKIEKNSIKTRDNLSVNTSLSQEFISCIKQYVSSGGVPYFFKRYKDSNNLFKKLTVRFQVLFSLSMGSLSLISAITTALIFGYGGMQVINGALTLGGIITFNIYFQRLLSPILNLASVNMELHQAKVSIKKIFSFLSNEKFVDCTYIPHKIEGNLEFRKVFFSYNESPLLENLNMVIEPGKITAVVGKSGQGKSTLINLLYRFYDIQSGEVLFDGINIKNINRNWLRNQISIISQDIFLIDETLKNNLTFGNPKIEEDEIHDVLTKSSVSEFLPFLPEGIETRLGENGVKLSGGQKQRIAIARAMLNPAPIVILDEATSYLDSIIEESVMKELLVFFKNKTVILITHKYNHLHYSDSIFVLSDGQIVESGSYEELIKEEGLFTDLYIKEMATGDMQ